MEPGGATSESKLGHRFALPDTDPRHLRLRDAGVAAERRDQVVKCANPAGHTGYPKPHHASGGVPQAVPMPSCLGSGAMSGLLRPIGPKPAQIYWARRALVFGAAMVLAIACALIIKGASSGSAAQQDPPSGADSAGSATAA